MFWFSGHVGKMSFQEVLFVLTKQFRSLKRKLEICKCCVSFASRCICIECTAVNSVIMTANLNPHLPNEFSHPYQLDESIFHLGGYWCTFFIFISFFIQIPVSKQCRPK